MLIMHIGHISRTQSFQQNRHIIFHALVALKLLVSLISRLVACSARIVVDKQTDTQTNYCNPRCACTPRVNEGAYLIHIWINGVVSSTCIQNVSFLLLDSTKVQNSIAHFVDIGGMVRESIRSKNEPVKFNRHS